VVGVAAVLALCASLVWGAADFLGGTAARRIPVPGVIAVSQGAALVGLIAVAGLGGSYGDDPGYLGWALAAAVVGVVGLAAFYEALATGTMGVVAPIAATGVVGPVIVGGASGDRPSLAQAIGLVAAVAGVVLASGPQVRGGSGRRPIVLAMIAGAAFGAVIVCVAHGARSSTVMTLLVMRATSVVAMGVLVGAGRAQVGATARDLPLLVAIGAGDVGANALFAVASTRGLLSVVAVLSSLYPAVTVLLARYLHAERMSSVQNVGVVATLAGVVLLASGGG
jgi:drug/metabolite transporter (DMT)-like permease